MRNARGTSTRTVLAILSPLPLHPVARTRDMLRLAVLLLVGDPSPPSSLHRGGGEAYPTSHYPNSSHGADGGGRPLLS